MSRRRARIDARSRYVHENRATIGGMVGNNSAGSGSVRYGMTIDHVRSLDVMLSDGSRARLNRSTTPSTHDARPATHWRGASTPGWPMSWPAMSSRSPTTSPSSRRAGGYRLDRRLADATPFDLAKFVVGSEGTLVIATRARVDLVPKPRRTVFAVGHFTSVPAAIAATEDALSCDPAQVDDGQDHPRPVTAEDRVRRARRVAGRRSGCTAFRVVHGRRPGRAHGEPRPAGCPVARTPAWVQHPARRFGKPAGRAAEGAQVQPRPADGCLGRHAEAVGLRRGHRGRPGSARRVHDGSRSSSTGTA